MDWRQAVGMVFQRRVEKKMGEALGCRLQRADDPTLERLFETCPSSFPKLLPAADLGLDAALTLTSRLGRPGSECSLPVGDFAVYRLGHGMSAEPRFTRAHSFSCLF